MAAFKRWFWVVVAWLGLPGDFHWWWTVGFPLVGATAIDAILVFVREAPFWELVSAFIIACIALFLIASWWRKPRASTVPTSSASPTYNMSVHVGAQSEDRQRVEVISQMQGLLAESERAFKSWTFPSNNDQENRGKEAQESYNALKRCYEANTIWLDRQLCEKIEEYLSITYDVLVDFSMLTEPNDTLRAWNLPDDPRARDEIRTSVSQRVRVELPNLRHDIEEGFREVLRQQ